MDKPTVHRIGSQPIDARRNYKRVILFLCNRLDSSDRTDILNTLRVTNFDYPRRPILDPFQGISSALTDEEFDLNLDGILLNLQQLFSNAEQRIKPRMLSSADALRGSNSLAATGDADGKVKSDPDSGGGSKLPVILPDREILPTLISVIMDMPPSPSKQIAVTYLPILRHLEKDIDDMRDYLVAHPNDLKRLLLTYDLVSTAISKSHSSLDGSLIRSLLDTRYNDLTLKTEVGQDDKRVITEPPSKFTKGIATGDIYVDMSHAHSPFLGNAQAITALISGILSIFTAKTATGQTMIEGFFEAIGLLDSAADRQAQAEWVKLKASEAQWMHGTVDGSIYQDWYSRYLSSYLEGTVGKELIYPLNVGLWKAFKDVNPSETEVIDMWQRAMLADLTSNKNNALGIESIADAKVMKSSTTGPKAVFNYIKKWVSSRKYKDGSNMADDNLLRIISAGSDWRVGLKFSDGWDNTYATFKRTYSRPLGTQWQAKMDVMSTEAQNFARYMTQFKGKTFAEVSRDILKGKPFQPWDKSWLDQFKLAVKAAYEAPVVVDPIIPPVVIPDVPGGNEEPVIIPGPVVPYNPEPSRSDQPTVIVTPNHVIYGSGQPNDLSDLFMLGKALDEARLSSKMIYPALEGDAQSPLEGSAILAGLASKALVGLGKKVISKIAEGRAAKGKAPIGGLVGKVIDKIKQTKIDKNTIGKDVKSPSTDSVDAIVNSGAVTGLLKDTAGIDLPASFQNVMTAFDANRMQVEEADAHIMKLIEDMKILAISLKGLDSKVDMLLNSLLATTVNKIPFYSPVSKMINGNLNNPVVTLGDIVDSIEPNSVVTSSDGGKRFTDATRMQALSMLFSYSPENGLRVLTPKTLSAPMRRILIQSLKKSGSVLPQRKLIVDDEATDELEIDSTRETIRTNDVVKEGE